MTSHKRSANERAESGQQTGSGDGLIDLMRYAGVLITRENYLDLAYIGEPPSELSAEEEANLPAMLRKLK
jgi:hypothetical protein